MKREQLELFKAIMRTLRSLMVDYSEFYASEEGEASAGSAVCST